MSTPHARAAESSLLTEREVDVMSVLWDHSLATVVEVQAKLEMRLAYTTVLAVLRVLERKGHVGHRRSGRRHRYFALTSREATSAGSSKGSSTGSSPVALIYLSGNSLA